MDYKLLSFGAPCGDADIFRLTAKHPGSARSFASPMINAVFNEFPAAIVVTCEIEHTSGKELCCEVERRNRLAGVSTPMISVMDAYNMTMMTSGWVINASC